MFLFVDLLCFKTYILYCILRTTYIFDQKQTTETPALLPFLFLVLVARRSLSAKFRLGTFWATKCEKNSRFDSKPPTNPWTFAPLKPLQGMFLGSKVSFLRAGKNQDTWGPKYVSNSWVQGMFLRAGKLKIPWLFNVPMYDPAQKMWVSQGVE